MALNGRLEDMNLLEILQIVAFSKKTGMLEVSSPQSNGSILFRNGRLLCAFASSTAAAARELAGKPLDPKGQTELADIVQRSLRELIPLREGRFEFRLSRSLPVQWSGLDASSFLLGDGIDPQSILLGLAREIDEARRDSTRLLEVIEEVPSSESTSLAETGWTVLVVDDEPTVARMLSQELGEAGLNVDTAGTPEEALERTSFHVRQARRPLLVVLDAGMPTSNGEGLDGGFEILERLSAIESMPAVLLMAESLPSGARARARRLGVRKILFKPTLTKLDPDEYGADLRAFARALRLEISRLALDARDRPKGTLLPPERDHEAIFDVLKALTERHASPAQGIARLILRVAAKYVERAALFLVKDGRASGLAGVHHGKPTAQLVDEVRAIAFELQHVQPFAEVVYSRRPVRIDDGRESFLPALDPGRSREQALFPLLHNHEVLAVLYCDNPETGAPLTKLTGLHLFLVQAGMALENASLHRKLRSLESRYSLEDQGPLTQELAPLAREDR